MSDPALHKKFALNVRAFNHILWERERESIALISQLFLMRSQSIFRVEEVVFLDLVKNNLAEASPFDRLWGNGLRANDPGACALLVGAA